MFLTAKREDRVRRLTDKFGLNERKAQDQIRKIDDLSRYKSLRRDQAGRGSRGGRGGGRSDRGFRGPAA